MANLDAAIDALGSLDLDGVDGPTLHRLVVASQEAASRLDAAGLRVTDRWDQEAVWADDGSVSPAARLARDARCARRTAGRRIHLARCLRTMEATAEAYRNGDLSTDHVTVLCRANVAHREPLMARDESLLVSDGKRLSPERFGRVVRYWSDAADNEVLDANVEDRAAAQADQRFLDVSRTLDGMVDLRGLLDPVTGEIVRAAIHRVEQRLFHQDWLASQERSGPGDAEGPATSTTSDTELGRTPRQRRADALRHLVEAAEAVPPGSVPARPLISVLVSYDELAGPVRETFNGTVFTPGQVAGLLTEADVERIVFDGPDRVLGVGARRRFFSGAERRAVEVRDRTCRFPGCTVEAEWCEVDHVVEYGDGGPTLQENGRLLCPRHNRQRPGRRGPPAPADPDP